MLKANRDAAFGEVAVFSLLKTYFRVKREPADAPGTGGADFVCLKDTPDEFVVEVTSLKPDAIAAQSGIPATIGGLSEKEWKSVQALFRRPWELPEIRMAWDALSLEYGES